MEEIIMMKTKKLAAALLAVLTSLAAVGCGDGDSNGGGTSSVDEYDLGSHEDAVSVEDTEEIASMDTIPESERELIWLSYFDINPTRANPETRTDLDLFQKKGGKITYDKTQSLEKYTKLAEEILSGSPPDMFWYEANMTFPYNVTRKMFQPVDPIIDFDSDLWKDVKETADTFVLNGGHYVAPVKTINMSVMGYDKNMVEAAELEDPYELWQEGNWNWNTWYDMMTEFCAGSTEDNPRYGINGWFAPFIFYSTGKTIIMFDQDKQEYYNNMDDPDFVRAADLLYDIKKNDMYYPEWLGQASDCYNNNILFYAMGPWASINEHSPKDDESWGMVPIPSDPNSDENYIIPGIETYMWVAGSKKDVAMKTWMECAKIVTTDDKYKQTEREKFDSQNPNWTDEMYYVAYELPQTDYYHFITDPGMAINTAISDDDVATNDSKEAVNKYMYTSVMKQDENSVQYTWTTLKETYRPVIDSGIKEINELYKAYIAG